MDTEKTMHDTAALRKKLKGKTAVALGGGAALGVSHIGVLRALEEFDIRPSILSGNSAGALIGGIYSTGIGMDEMYAIARSVDAKKSAALFRPTLHRGGLIDGKAVKKFIHDIIGDVRIEDLPIPFIVSAVDLNSGELLYFTKGPLIDAIMASISVPGVFVPYKANGTLLVDGGIRSTIPLEALPAYDPDITIGVSILKKGNMAKTPRFTEIHAALEEENEYDPKNFLEVLQNTLNLDKLFPNKDVPISTSIVIEAVSIMLTGSGYREMEIADPDIKLVIDVTETKLWEFSHGAEVVEKGYQQARRQLENYLGEPGKD
ncbi:MAG: patatin-like phospholipase family protein [Spirochaetia bacterium]|nr:patatin-like phospholipase family protein [Spirochaetia bacterium]